MPDPAVARRAAWAAALAAALAAAVLHAPSLGYGFAFDDASEVVRNDHIRSLASAPRIFASGAWAGAGETAAPMYRPLTTLSYAVNFALGGLAPLGYHLANVLLHAAASALAVALALRLGLGAAAAGIAGVLFAIHPAHVEAVANVAGRKEILLTIFVLLAALGHAAALRRGRAFAVLPALAVAGALFSKESGVAAIGALAAWDLLADRDGWRARPRRALALWAVYLAEVAAFEAARHAVIGSVGVPLSLIPYVENPLAHAPAGQRLLTAVAVLGRGLALLVFPRSLAPDYSFDAIPLATSPLDPRFLVSAAALAAIAVLAVRHLRQWPVLAFAVAWYAVGIFPASNLAVKVGTVFGDRLLYLPSVGFCLVAGALLARAVAPGRARAVRIAAVAAAGAALSVRTVVYERAWADEVSLFTEAVRAEPASGKAHDLLGAAFMEVGRTEEGVRELEAAVRILERAPGTPSDERVKLGVAYERLGRLDDAAAVYDRVLADAPGFPDALWRLGVVRWAQGRRDEASRLWERTIAAQPDHARAMSDLGIAALARGDAALAESLWTRAAAVDPRAPGPWLSLGNLYARRGETARAREAWERFLDRARYGAYAREREAVEARLRSSSGSDAR